MFSVIFEARPRPDEWDSFLGQAKMLQPELEQADGFIDHIWPEATPTVSQDEALPLALGSGQGGSVGVGHAAGGAAFSPCARVDPGGGPQA